MNFTTCSVNHRVTEGNALRTARHSSEKIFYNCKKQKNAQESISGPKIKNPPLGSRKADFNAVFSEDYLTFLSKRLRRMVKG